MLPLRRMAQQTLEHAMAGRGHRHDTEGGDHPTRMAIGDIETEHELVGEQPQG